MKDQTDPEKINRAAAVAAAEIAAADHAVRTANAAYRAVVAAAEIAADTDTDTDTDTSEVK